MSVKSYRTKQLFMVPNIEVRQTLEGLLTSRGMIRKVSLYSLICYFLLSQINIWTTTTWSNVWVVLPKPS